MLSYRHAFHAGNFADVFKHLVLVQILRHLCLKDKPCCFIDTHAGAGGYALEGTYAQQNREFDGGIGQLWANPGAPSCVQDYLDLVREYNGQDRLRFYPGSPWFAQRLLRPNDKLWLYELHSTEALHLAKAFGNDRRITLFEEDALKHAPGLLPPVQRRGLVFIDPSYELKTDFDKVPKTLAKMLVRFATGSYALWYPVLQRARVRQLERSLKQLAIADLHLYEFGISRDTEAPGMTGCGMVLVNPPWTLAAQLAEALPWLVANLGVDGGGYFRCEDLSVSGRLD